MSTESENSLTADSPIGVSIVAYTGPGKPPMWEDEIAAGEHTSQIALSD